MDTLVITVVRHPFDARMAHRRARASAEARPPRALSRRGRPWTAVVPAHVKAIDLPRAAGRHRLRGTRSLLATAGRAVHGIIVHHPELVPSPITVGLDRAVWDVHENTAAALADQPRLPRWAAPAGEPSRAWSAPYGR